MSASVAIGLGLSWVAAAATSLGWLMKSRGAYASARMRHRRPVLSLRVQPAPSTVSAGASVSVSGASYQAELLSARAFPSGTLRVALLALLPRPPFPPRAVRPCGSRRGAASRCPARGESREAQRPRGSLVAGL
jgi:hypothetical protein